MKPLRIHHVNLTVAASEELTAREFYLGFLGLAEIPKPDSLKANGGFWATLGAVELHVSLQDGIDRAVARSHVAFEVEDLEAWRAAILEQGLAPLASNPIPGMSRFEFRDPFGNRLELLESE